MKRGILFALVLALLTAVSAAQDAPPIKARFVDVGEVIVEAGAQPKTESRRVLHVFKGQKPGTNYIVVKVFRNRPAGAPSPLDALDIKLTLGSVRPVLPYAVSVLKRNLTEAGDAYVALLEKSRQTSESYYFPVKSGGNDWVVEINGKSAAKVLDYYATLVIHNVDDRSSRIELPDGTRPVINPRRRLVAKFPAGSYKLELAVRGHGKTKLPWQKYEKGELKYIAVMTSLQYAPIIPSERLRTALPKITRAYKMFGRLKGPGGGTYNVGNRDRAVHVRIQFGTIEKPSRMTKASADRIVLIYEREDDGEEKGKPSRRKKKKSSKRGARVIKYSHEWGSHWYVQSWEKARYVNITNDAKKIVGEAKVGAFLIRSTEKKPSIWSKDGLLAAGVIYDKDHEYIEVKVKREKSLIVMTGTKTKEP